MDTERGGGMDTERGGGHEHRERGACKQRRGVEMHGKREGERKV